MSFPRYEDYKDSGESSVGRLPMHWSIKRLKDLATYNDEILTEDTPKEFGLLYVDISSVDSGRGIIDKQAMRFAEAPSRARRRVIHGDVIVSTVRTYLKAIARIERPEDNLVVSTGFTVIRPGRELDVGFAGYVLLSNLFVDEVIARSVGVSYPAISPSSLVRVNLPVPPLPEQRAIAAFLDRETSKIDALVADQRRLIELLKEKRQAVISHAVTKGLDPIVPMKDSGIPWLGKVPEHWEVSRFGWMCDYISYGFTNPMPTTEEGPYMLTANDVDFGSVRYDTARRTSQAAFDSLLTDKCRPKKDDLLLTKDGTLGRVAIHDGRTCCINQSVALLRVNKSELLPAFACAALQGGIYQMRMVYEAGGTTIKHIYISRLAKMPMARPSLDEQVLILEKLLKRLEMFDELIAEAARSITLLQERRTALISAAVTGKIDVRNQPAMELV